MLEIDSGFDETELGFPKFSRFLAQAAEDGACSDDADCRTFSSYCGGCRCEALDADAPDPKCPQRSVACIVDPCRGKVARCLEEGILAGPDDGDIGAVFGFGYPPMRGGPFRHIDTLGAGVILDRVLTLQGRYGDAYAAPELLQKIAKDRTTFAAR